MPIFEFRGKGYKRAAMARSKLVEYECLTGSATTLVAYDEATERFFPVVIYRDSVGVNVANCAHYGITVLN